MTFFVTSVGKGNGADLGGLDGADAHCNALAKAAGSQRTNWRAYLSTTQPGGHAGVNARDRIGKGPWRNAQGGVVARNLDELHSDRVNAGHHDRVGLQDTRHMRSWNSSHGTIGCSQEALRKTGSAGLFYCFAPN